MRACGVYGRIQDSSKGWLNRHLPTTLNSRRRSGLERCSISELPRISRVFSLGFLGDNAARSYTVAGAFVAWVTERWGAGVLHAWYAGESLERLTLRPWDDLDAEFRAALRTLELPAGASAYARARFDRPSVWSRRCPHMVDLVDQHGDACRNEGRFALAQEAY